MEWIQTVTIIGSLGGFIMWITQRLEKDIQRLDSDIKELSGKVDTETRTLHRRMDQLYQVIIDLLNKK